MIFFFKQKTAYEIKECDWSSDVCSSDLILLEVSIAITISIPLRFISCQRNPYLGPAAARIRDITPRTRRTVLNLFLLRLTSEIKRWTKPEAAKQDRSLVLFL